MEQKSEFTGHHNHDPINYVGTRSPESTSINLVLFNQTDYVEYKIPDIQTFINKTYGYQGQIWVTVQGLADAQMIQEFCQHLKIHPLVIEDILNINQRSKADYYSDYMFSVIKIHDIEPNSGKLYFRQVSFVLMENILITFSETTQPIQAELTKKISKSGSKYRKIGVDYLWYAFIDMIIDRYAALMDEKIDYTEDLEGILIQTPQRFSLNQLYKIKRETINLRKVILPIRDMVSLLIKENVKFIPQSMDLYWRDLYDHCTRLLETVDTQREMLAVMLDIYLSNVNLKINETMKILTIFATIFIPLTFITGIYGMNFKYMPEIEWHYGYFFVLALMAGVVALFLIFFRKLKWL